MRAPITIVIPTRDEAEQIVACIRRVLRAVATLRQRLDHMLSHHIAKLIG